MAARAIGLNERPQNSRYQRMSCWSMSSLTSCRKHRRGPKISELNGVLRCVGHCLRCLH
jgi:hypothetical protein